MTDPRQHLDVTETLREPVLRAAIRSLQLPPGSHGLDAGCGIGFPSLLLVGRMHAAGLQEISGRTLAGDAQAPLTNGMRSALIALFEMRWPGAEAELSSEDRATYGRLCLPESPEFIVDQPGCYVLFTCTLFQGRVPL